MNVYVVGFNRKKGLKLGRDDNRMPGTKVPEASEWKENVLRAHINQGFIQTEAEYNVFKDAAEVKDLNLKKAPVGKGLKPQGESGNPPSDPPGDGDNDSGLTVQDLKDMPYNDLKALCAEHKVKVSGKRAKLEEEVLKAISKK